MTASGETARDAIVPTPSVKVTKSSAAPARDRTARPDAPRPVNKGKPRDGPKMDQYQRYLKGREHIVGLKDSVNYLDGLLKKSRQQIEAIQKAKDITPERKAEIIREVERSRSEYLKQVPVLKDALNSPAKLPAVGGLYRD